MNRVELERGGCELAKWHELDATLSRMGMHITPEIADAYGLRLLLAGAVVAVVGVMMARSSKKR